MTAKIRIEYVRLRRGGDQGAMDADVIALAGGASEELTVAGTSLLSAAAPVFADGAWNSGVHVKIIGLSGAAYVEVGDNTTLADNAGGNLVTQGRVIYRPIEAGQYVAAVEAAGAGALSPEASTAPPPSGLTATILSAQSLSDAVQVDGKLVGVVLPAGWTAAAVSFRASLDGVSYFDVYDGGVERQIASADAVAQRHLALPLGDWLGVKHVRIRSGLAAAAQNQVADRAITLVVSG